MRQKPKAYKQSALPHGVPDFVHRKSAVARAAGYGVPCPTCGSCLSKVHNSRPLSGYIWRQRVCENCRQSWHTYESNAQPGTAKDNVQSIRLFLLEMLAKLEEQRHG